MKNNFRIEGCIVWLSLTRGKETCIDLKNLETAAKHKWYAAERRKIFYAATNVRKDSGRRGILLLHQLLRGKGVDHSDRDGLNNLEENLRPASFQQQMQNQGLRSDNSSGFKGVSWSKLYKKWLVHIRVGGRNRHLGYFISKEEAARVYDAAARENFGEFAFLNFPDLTEKDSLSTLK